RGSCEGHIEFHQARPRGPSRVPSDCGHEGHSEFYQIEAVRAVLSYSTLTTNSSQTIEVDI
ncbi:hypothetical protein HAX54_016169, partial [Datura stramonium]|nr:hypothetical protein [Datura stramonium]